MVVVVLAHFLEGLFGSWWWQGGVYVVHGAFGVARIRGSRRGSKTQPYIQHRTHNASLVYGEALACKAFSMSKISLDGGRGQHRLNWIT